MPANLNHLYERNINNRRCCIADCNDRTSHRFRFPSRKNIELRKMWLERINNPKITQLSNRELYKQVVCARHFSPKDLRHLLRGSYNKEMKASIIPSLYLNSGKKPIKSKKISSDDSNESKYTGKPCCVPGCQDQNSHRFRFPKKQDKGLINAWLENINNSKIMDLPYEKLYSDYMVCAKHFLPAHLLPKYSRRGIADNAVPCVFIDEKVRTVMPCNRSRYDLKPCSVPGCHDKESPRFRFPKKSEKAFQKVWLKKINNPKLNNISSEQLHKHVVCRRHFLPSQLTSRGGKKGITDDAIPYLFLNRGDDDDIRIVEDNYDNDADMDTDSEIEVKKTRAERFGPAASNKNKTTSEAKNKTMNESKPEVISIDVNSINLNNMSKEEEYVSDDEIINIRFTERHAEKLRQLLANKPEKTLRAIQGKLTNFIRELFVEFK